MVRRQCLRLLRARSLLLATAGLALLYAIKTWTAGPQLSVLPHKNAMTSDKIAIFVPSSLKKIDWHNYTLIAEEAKRVGTGEHGKPAVLPPEDSKLEEELYAANGFNGALSDKIALNRSVPDIRHRLCQQRRYIQSLPTVSVVVPFHNEHWSTLLRTAVSVIVRSPPELLKEIWLVDDASTKEFLKEKLEQYVSRHLPKVRVLRLSVRRGLIAARLAGARAAAADALVFLDSHTECSINWLPPLLEPIALDYRTAVCPFIDVVAYDTFEYRAQDEGARGAFDWEFFYKRLPVLPKDQANMPEPFPSPVMAGGLFAISRAWFWELGGYDPGLDIWGGEQYELSFKIWQCGGRMLDAPCSRVGHIYRKFAPFPNPNHGDFVGKNYRRVAEVWMDGYSRYLYSRRPHYRDIPTGDISDQKALREKLKCKSFRWFLTQVAFDLTAKYPPVEPEPFAEGRIRPASHGQLLLKLVRQATAARCKNKNSCWDLPESAAKSPVLLFSCHLGGGNQEWRYDAKTHQIRKSATVCLDWDVPSRALFVQPCDAGSETQQWTVDAVHAHRLAEWGGARRSVTGPEEY